MGSAPASLTAQLWQFRRKLSDRYAIERMILFGSHARGEARRDSDVDLIVVSPRFRGKNAIDRAASLRLEWDLRRSVDFLCYTPEEFRELSRRPSIVSVALQEGVQIPA